MLKIRKITQEDYSIISSWCKDWGFPDVTCNQSALPATGFIVSDDEQDIICGFLYLTDSIFAHPEWIISNKNYKNKLRRKEAFIRLFDGFKKETKLSGRSLLLMSVKNKNLMKNLREFGFAQTDTDMTNFILTI